jgi:glutamate:GABA antiporter
MLGNQRILGVFALAMISVCAVINLRGAPLMASMGLSAVFFYLMAALLFLIPSSLVCAELGSTWPHAGGVYLWVQKAFGDKIGFLAIWLEWINNVISFPASLSFIAATLAYIIQPDLVQNRLFIFICTLTVLWGATCFNMLGIKASSRLNIIGALAGTIIPAVVIMMLASYWLLSGRPSQINFSMHHFFPRFEITNLVFFTGVLSGYAGMQITAFHAPNVKNPQKNFPRAIFLAVIVILLVTIFTSLAIGIVVPNNHLSLISGLMEGFAGFFSVFHLPWAVPVLAALIVMGAFSTLSAWLLGPARGLLTAAQQGRFINYFSKQNQREVPSRILILQAVIASLLAIVFLLTPDASSAFWILLDLSSQSTLLMYILVFSAAVCLRYKQPHTERPFRIVGGNLGMWFIAGAGILASGTAIIIGFFPPQRLHIASTWHYEIILLGCSFAYLLIPFLITRYIGREKFTTSSITAADNY